MNPSDNGIDLTDDEILAYDAAEVKLLLSKPMVQHAFAMTRLSIMAQWERAESTPVREFCWAKLKALTEFQTKLRALTERKNLQLSKE